MKDEIVVDDVTYRRVEEVRQMKVYDLELETILGEVVLVLRGCLGGNLFHFHDGVIHLCCGVNKDRAKELGLKLDKCGRVQVRGFND